MCVLKSNIILAKVLIEIGMIFFQKSNFFESNK